MKSIRWRLRRVFIAPGNKKNQADAGANGGIGDVERGKTDLAAAALLHIEINEIKDERKIEEFSQGGEDIFLLHNF